MSIDLISIVDLAGDIGESKGWRDFGVITFRWFRHAERNEKDSEYELADKFGIDLKILSSYICSAEKTVRWRLYACITVDTHQALDLCEGYSVLNLGMDKRKI